MQNINLKSLIRKNLPPILASFFCFFLFFDGFKTYFHQDDFIQMFYSQNPSQVFDAFNIFKKAEFAFYRPIPTQLYFYITKAFFGWNPPGYHLVNFIIFSLNIFLFYRLAKILFNKRVASFSLIFFSINITHFAPLHAASYVHELFLVFFTLLSCLSFAYFLKNNRITNFVLSVLFFIFALMSKETAVVIPGLIAIEYLFFSPKMSGKKLLKIVLLFSVVLFFYLFFHYFFYGMPESSSYKLVLGKDSLKMYSWYFIWGLSAPNILIDFLEPGLKIRSVFFEITKFNGYFFLVSFSILILSLAVLTFMFLYKKRKQNKIIFFGILWFFLSLIPLVVFPLHKLAIEQALAIVGLSLFIGNILSLQSKRLAIAITVLYVFIAINSAVIARKTHWIIRSAIQAENIVEEINKHKISKNEIIYFINGSVKIPEYGSSKQIFLASGNAKLFPLMFKIPTSHVFFEEISPPTNYTGEILRIDSSKLLGY